jgi:hypothetical protein
LFALSRLIREYEEMSIRDVVKCWEREAIKNVVEHGCVSGCAPGLVYYSETVAFHDEHESEIWDMLHEDAEEQGISIVKLIASFNGGENVGSMDQFKNLLSWYAVERVCAQELGAW